MTYPDIDEILGNDYFGNLAVFDKEGFIWVGNWNKNGIIIWARQHPSKTRNIQTILECNTFV